MNNNLTNLQGRFNDTLFRIPDYQRGYSWGNQQIEDFWVDVVSMLPGQQHYTGMLSIKKKTLEEIESNREKWINEKWLVDAGYSIYEIVDGQQRLTTIIILINEIINCAKKYNLTELNNLPLEEIEEKYLYKEKPLSSLKAYKFGYEVDNPSYNYFKKNIIGDRISEEVTETFYTKNLDNARNIFAKKLEELINTKGIKELEIILKKVTQFLMFNIYDINENFDVYIAFETMNNRGKKLSYLELLKNRLIHLTMLTKRDKEDREVLRKEINTVWKNIYGYLGKSTTLNLSDDEFLQHHWMIYFGHHTRKIEGNKNIPFHTYLLGRHFIQQNLKINELSLPEIYEESYTDEELDREKDIIENNEITEDINNKRVEITYEHIESYIKSLNELIKYWYMTYESSEAKDLEIQKYLFRLNELGYVNARPLVTVILSKEDISTEKKVESLKKIERFNFLHYRLNNYSSTYNNTVFYNLARDLYLDKITIDKVIEITSKIDYLADNNVVATDGIVTKFEKLIKRDGFYSWGTLKYVLYIRDISYSNISAEHLLDPKDYFKQGVKDWPSVEHIYPQKATDEYWVSRFNDKYDERQRKKLCGSLGNLLPLSKRENSKLHNYSFEQKKERFKIGSQSERKVYEEGEWTPEKILNRGMEILKFLELEFEFIIQNDATRKRILGLDFMIDEKVDYDNTIEPLYEYVEKESTREFNEKDFNYLLSTSKEEVLENYRLIEEYIMNINPNIIKYTTKNYVGFHCNQVFVEYHFLKNIGYLILCDLEYDDPLNKTWYLGINYKWTKNTRMDIKTKEDVEYAKNIIFQSYKSLN